MPNDTSDTVAEGPAGQEEVAEEEGKTGWSSFHLREKWNQKKALSYKLLLIVIRDDITQ